MIVQGEMRQLRHQERSEKEDLPFGGTKKYQAIRKWKELESVFDAAMWPIDGDKERIDELRKQMNDALNNLW